MAICTKFVFDEIAPLPVETMLQSERDAGIANEASVAEQIEAEREAVRVLARAEGFEAGLKHAQSTQAATTAELVARLTSAAEAAFAQIDAQVELLVTEATALAMDLAEALADEALHRAPRAALEAALRTALHDAVARPKITVRVNPADLAHAETLLTAEAASTGFEGRMMIMADAAIAAGDCDVDWQSGGLRLSREAKRDAVCKLVSCLEANAA